MAPHHNWRAITARRIALLARLAVKWPRDTEHGRWCYPWDVSHLGAYDRHVYHDLLALVKQGLVEVRPGLGRGRQKRTLYAITAAGRALHVWAEAHPGQEAAGLLEEKPHAK